MLAWGRVEVKGTKVLRGGVPFAGLLVVGNHEDSVCVDEEALDDL